VAAKIPGWRISWFNIFSLREYIARLLSARWTVETSSDGLAPRVDSKASADAPAPKNSRRVTPRI
jgi:hypothetical protein